MTSPWLAVASLCKWLALVGVHVTDEASFIGAVWSSRWWDPRGCTCSMYFINDLLPCFGPWEWKAFHVVTVFWFSQLVSAPLVLFDCVLMEGWLSCICDSMVWMDGIVWQTSPLSSCISGSGLLVGRWAVWRGWGGVSVFSFFCQKNMLGYAGRSVAILFSLWICFHCFCLALCQAGCYVNLTCTMPCLCVCAAYWSMWSLHEPVGRRARGLQVVASSPMISIMLIVLIPVSLHIHLHITYAVHTNHFTTPAQSQQLYTGVHMHTHTHTLTHTKELIDCYT